MISLDVLRLGILEILILLGKDFKERILVKKLFTPARLAVKEMKSYVVVDSIMEHTPERRELHTLLQAIPKISQAFWPDLRNCHE